MSEVKQKLFDNQAEAVRKKEVFTKIATCKNKGDGTVSRELEAGIVFVAGNTKLMSKDGSNNVLVAIGLEDYEGKVDVGASKFFRPTTFEELVTAFQYTDSAHLGFLFRSQGENNSNLNALLCTFLKNNLGTESVDVKALATTSMQIKGIIEEKSQHYYDEKVSFYENKIQRYQEKIQTIRNEQYGQGLYEGGYEETECSMGTVLDSYLQTLSVDNNPQQTTQVGVEEMLDYINKTKETLVDTNLSVWNTKNQLPGQMSIEVQE